MPDHEANFDDYLSLPEAAEMLPGKPTRASLWRWARIGLNGEVLRTVRISKGLYTRREWLIDFFERVGAADRAGWAAAQQGREVQHAQ